MGFKKSKASSVIAIAAALLLSGCSEDENSSSTYSSAVSQSSSSTSGASSSSVSEETSDVSAITPDPHYLDNYSDVVDDALNAVDTSKPIINEEQTNSGETGENDQNGQTSSAPSSSSTSQTSSSSTSSSSEPTTSAPSSSSEPTTSAPSSSSSNQSGQTSSSSTSGTTSLPTPPSSLTNPYHIELPEGAVGEYFDKNGNPMPDNFDPSNGGYFDKLGDYVFTPAERDAFEQAAKDAHEKIDNGTLDTTAGMTQEEKDYLLELWGFQ